MRYLKPLSNIATNSAKKYSTTARRKIDTYEECEKMFQRIWSSRLPLLHHTRLAFPLATLLKTFVSDRKGYASLHLYGSKENKPATIIMALEILTSLAIMSYHSQDSIGQYWLFYVIFPGNAN
ncbi:hypothetical protein J6590_061166 [Homalodisca vitripennis]|nr:hypothetical protein J6590_061166 [Homalodisca vitripennis]